MSLKIAVHQRTTTITRSFSSSHKLSKSVSLVNQRVCLNLPSGNLTLLLKMTIYSGFTHWRLWFSIVVLVYQRVHFLTFPNQSTRLSFPNLAVAWPLWWSFGSNSSPRPPGPVRKENTTVISCDLTWPDMKMSLRTCLNMEDYKYIMSILIVYIIIYCIWYGMEQHPNMFHKSILFKMI